MCARYTLTPEQAKLVFGGLVHIFAFAPRYNIGPTQRVPVILNTAGGIQAVDMRWGIPSTWSKTLHINAQAERITEARTFKPLLGQRCLVPMDGFYEWKPDKSPVRFVRPGRELFCVAGLWKADAQGHRPQEWERDRENQAENLLAAPTVEKIQGQVPNLITDYSRPGQGAAGCPGTFVLLTTAANASVTPIHNRMPFIVRESQYDRWLESSEIGLLNSELLSEDRLDWYPVSREVNKVRAESPDLVRPVEAERELF